MAQKTNILSFDDAKRKGASSRPASARSERRRASSSQDSRPQREARAQRRSRDNQDAYASSSPRLARTESSAARPLPSWLTAAQEQTARETQHFSNRGAAQQRTRHSAIMSYDEFLEEEQAEGAQAEETTKGGKKTLFQKISDARRKRAKEKAGKSFSRQYGDAGSSSAEADPRAAVYRGEMGSAQRRAQRMQSAESGQSRRSQRAAMKAASPQKSGVLGWIANAAGGISAAVSAPFAGKSAQRPSQVAEKSPRASRFSFKGIISALFGTPRRIALCSVAVCLVAACVFMYPAAQQYYTELRYLQQVQAEYDAVVERNQQLTTTRNYLQSDAGVEQTAHDNYGWVTEGENSVLVYGLPEDDTIAETNLYIKRGSVAAPETWYSVFLDPFFGVE